jgi:hypothetical protein
MVLCSTRVSVLVVLTLGMVVGPAAPAWADKQDARKHYEQATAAFGLGRYADAAGEYEAAFRLRPEPALLYNCAQSYRLAGNRARALELYRNYVRLYGDAPNADDARKHANDLELEIASASTASAQPSTHSVPAETARPAVSDPSAASPPTLPTPLTPSSPPPSLSSFGTTPEPTPTPATTLAPVPAPGPDVHLVDATASPLTDAPRDAGQRPLVRRPWFWVAIGAAVVGGTVAILLATSGDKDPKPTLGVVAGN